MKPQLYTNDFDTFQINAHLIRRGRIAFFQKHVRGGPNKVINPHPDLKRGFNCVVQPNIYSVGPPILDSRLKQLVGDRYNLSFPQRGLKRIDLRLYTNNFGYNFFAF